LLRERARPGRSFPRPRGKPGRTENSQARLDGERAESWARGAPSYARGGRAPQARFRNKPKIGVRISQVGLASHPIQTQKRGA